MKKKKKRFCIVPRFYLDVLPDPPDLKSTRGIDRLLGERRGEAPKE
jgi:hypothetical protein